MTDHTQPTPEKPAEPAWDPFASTTDAAAPGSAGAAGATASTTYRPNGAYAAASVHNRRGPRFGTIFWGVVLLVFAAFMAVWTLQPTDLDPTLWLLGSVIVLGLLLVVAGIAAALRRAD